MLLALVTSLTLAVVSITAGIDSISWLQAMLDKLDLSSVLLNGVLCFMLFAGSAGVQIKSLEDKKWVIMSLAIGSTIIACGLTGFLLVTVLGWFGVTLALALSLADTPEKPLIVNMTFGVVAFSILVQGSTIGKLFSPDYLKNILKG